MLLQKCGVQEDAGKYVLNAVDPFHDTPMSVVGRPDGRFGRSLIFDIRQEAVITHPIGLASGEWDVHFTFGPQASLEKSNTPPNHVAVNLGNQAVNLGLADGADFAGNGLGAGMVWYHKVSSGTQTYLSSAAIPAGDAGGDNILSYIAANMGEGVFRVVGGGFEVANVTEALHKSGSVCVYKGNRDCSNAALIAVNKDATQVSMPFKVRAGPPTQLAQAKQMGGITWEAERGCMVVGHLVEQEDPSEGNFPEYYWNPNALSGTDTIGYCSPFFDENGTGKSASICISSPFKTGGAYFSGLAFESKLILTTRFLLELAPYGFSDLLPLAQLSPSLDERALRCLSEVQTGLLPGYPLSENGAGDFFKRSLGVLRSMVAPAGRLIGAIPHPMARAVGTGLELADGALRLAMKKPGKGAKKKK